MQQPRPAIKVAPGRPEPAVNAAPGSPELSIVVPTFNERSNVAELVGRLHEVLRGQSWEVIFVDDDSTDGTIDELRRLAAADHRIRVIQRIGRRGLSTACVEGMLSLAAPYLAVMDADLQHDETLLTEMLAALRDERRRLDLVIASRYVSGGATGEWHRSRVMVSRFSTRLSRLISRHDISDPMSGFFMLKREVLQDAVRNLSGFGFKILLDLFASSSRRLNFAELPYTFRARQAGQSKLDKHAAWNFGMLLLDKWFGHIIPVRFVAFTFVGLAGLAVHLSVQAILLNSFALLFPVSQAIATFVAMTSNFAINNSLTYRDRRLHGWQWLRGWISFCVVCGIGAIGNVGVATWVYNMDVRWFAAAMAGILISAVWNYSVTQFYTWNKTRP